VKKSSHPIRLKSERARSSVVELRTFNPGVVGSNPTGPSTDFSYLAGSKREMDYADWLRQALKEIEAPGRSADEVRTGITGLTLMPAAICRDRGPVHIFNHTF
jgi:hypothetical protein